MHSTNSFPRWVEVLFSRLLVRYGDAWTRKWDGIPMEAVKQDWQQTLDHIFARTPRAIAYALEHLPEYPPNADAFARLCLAAPSTQPAIEAPTGSADPVRLRALLETATAAMKDMSHQAQLLEKLTARETAGTLTGPQRHQLECMRRNGMGEASETMGTFTPIPTDLWPWVQRGQAPMSVSP